MTFTINAKNIDRESAKDIYEFNNRTFSFKEIINNKEICKYQNSLAEVIGKEKISCSVRLNQKDDTTQGDFSLNLMLQDLKKMSNIENQINQNSIEYSLDKGLERMKKDLYESN
jgi:hypothetical protein